MKEKIKNGFIGLGFLGALLPSLNVFAASTATEIMSTSMATVQSDILAMVALAVPVGFAIFGATISVKKGITFVQALINRA